MMTKKLIVFAAFLLLAVSSCKKDDPEVPNEEEVITTLNYTLTPTDGGATVVLTFKDLDGDGGNDPVITGGKLAANTKYVGVIELLNETESPAENITEEVEEEDEDHQFFFAVEGLSSTVAYDDSDSDGNPIGLKTVLNSGSAGSGKLKITLRHEPNKSGTNVSSGDISNAGGETDIEVTFPVTVE